MFFCSIWCFSSLSFVQNSYYKHHYPSIFFVYRLVTLRNGLFFFTLLTQQEFDYLLITFITILFFSSLKMFKTSVWETECKFMSWNRKSDYSFLFSVSIHEHLYANDPDKQKTTTAQYTLVHDKYIFTTVFV